MGSVKDLEIITKPTKDKMGVGKFIFSDRYSVFDWGAMPDLIEGKGQALCMMGAYCFEKLEEKGIRTHYRGLVDSKNKVVCFDELEQPSNVMDISLVNVYRPNAVTRKGRFSYDYSVFTQKLRNYLIPLEIIYRNGLPDGSSVFKRLEQGLISVKDLGLDHYPDAGEKLEKPIFDVSTKLEDKDRYVTWEEAKELAGLTYRETTEIQDWLLKVDRLTSQLAAKAGLENEDGKIELAFDPSRTLMVVDVVGTLDECRFTYDGFHVSKEIARQYYRKTEWYKDVEQAKKEAEKEGKQDWKNLCRTQPPRLDPTLKSLISQMYMAAANEITRRKIFEVTVLANIIKKLMNSSWSSQQ
jgi:phosphoribosylaminoimidazole-succinocarboxamide synthase